MVSSGAQRCCRANDTVRSCVRGQSKGGGRFSKAPQKQRVGETDIAHAPTLGFHRAVYVGSELVRIDKIVWGREYLFS